MSFTTTPQYFGTFKFLISLLLFLYNFPKKIAITTIKRAKINRRLREIKRFGSNSLLTDFRRSCGIFKDYKSTDL